MSNFSQVLRISCLAALFYSAQSAQGSPQSSPIESAGPLAINFDEFKDWNPAWVFTDAMKAARPWIKQLTFTENPWNLGGSVPTDAQGWPQLAPGVAAATVLLRDMDGVYPAGIYNAFWEGTGQLKFGLDATLIDQPAPKHARLSVTPGWEGILVKVISSDPADPIRNIRVIMPGFETNYTTQIFHPDFLDALEPFGVLRMMQWQNTNFSTLGAWADRPTPALFSQATDIGMSVEYMVALANTTGKSPWVCMPYLASDDFVRQFARYFAQNLDPDLAAYVEYSNEVWNNDFPAHLHATQNGLAKGLGPSSFDACLRWYSERSVQVMQIWRQEFELQHGASWPDRLVRVLAGQHVNPYTSETILEHQDAFLDADALAVAPYFGHGFGTAEQQWTTISKSVQQILDECALEIQTELIPKIQANVSLATSHGLVPIAYEGGQHLVASGSANANQALIDKLIEVNRHAGMYAVYRSFLDAWAASGAGFMTPYSFTGTYNEYGSWGHLEYLGQPLSESHKYRALIDFLAETDKGSVVHYGNGCQGLAIGYFGNPWVGTAQFHATLTGALTSAPVALHIAATDASFLGLPLPLDLAWTGAAGCQLWIGSSFSVGTTSDGAGNAAVPLTLPAKPSLVGAHLYLQWVAPKPGFGVLGLAFSGALDLTLGSS